MNDESKIIDMQLMDTNDDGIDVILAFVAVLKAG